MLWVCRELPFRKLEDRESGILKLALLLDLPEDPDARISDDECDHLGRAPYLDVHGMGAGMVNDVVDHLGDPERADGEHVLGEVLQERLDVL